MEINKSKSPEAYALVQQITDRLGRMHRALEPQVEKLAAIETREREQSQRLEVHRQFLENLEGVCPVSIDRDLMSQVELRQMLGKVREEINRARRLLP